MTQVKGGAVSCGVVGVFRGTGSHVMGGTGQVVRTSSTVFSKSLDLQLTSVSNPYIVKCRKKSDVKYRKEE